MPTLTRSHRGLQRRGALLTIGLSVVVAAVVAYAGHSTHRPLPWAPTAPSQWTPSGAGAPRLWRRPRREVERVVSSDLIRAVTRPTCVLGPPTLCAALAEPIDACVAGDAGACTEVGTYLDRNPPYPDGAVFFFHHGCVLGDARACAARSTADADCATQLGTCTRAAAERRDRHALAALCQRGAADACAVVASAAVQAGRDGEANTYLLAACEAGGPLACAEVARRYRADCTGTCAAPDPTVAAIAGARACSAGVAAACPPS